MTDKRKDLGKILKQRRLMIPLTLQELAKASGVSPSHLGRIERGQRFPSAGVMGKIAKALRFGEAELFALAGYLPAQPSTEVETPSRLDPYVAAVLSEEPVETQRLIITILLIFKSMTKGCECDIRFREYARRKYPEVDEDTITMIEDILQHPLKE